MQRGRGGHCLNDIAHHHLADRAAGRPGKKIGVEVEQPCRLLKAGPDVEVQAAAGGAAMKAPFQTIEETVPGQFPSQETGQAAIGAKGRDAGLEGAGPALVAVAVANHVAAMAQRKAVRKQPFECALGGMNFHCHFLGAVVCIGDIGVATAHMGIDHAALVRQTLEQQIGVVGVHLQVGTVH